MNKTVIIDKKKNLVRLNINLLFYTEEKIKEACKDFEEICSMRFLSSKENFVISLKPKKKNIDINILGFEFMNYLLGISKKRGF